MAWLQNLAGHAEHLLNKIDQNAATVLSDGSKQNMEEEDKGKDYYSETEKYKGPTIVQSASEPIISSVSRSSTPDIPEDTTEKKPDLSFTVVSENQKPSNIEEHITEKSLKSNQTSVSSNSLHNSYIESFIGSQELDILQAKIAKLEVENQDVNKQLLNMQHLYSEMRNENSNLQFQIERLNEQLSLAQNEKEQYVARAQRILQEKEKLITLKQTSASSEESDNIFTTYNEELKKELEFQQEKVKELTEKNAKLLSDMQSLQMQHQVIQQGLSQLNQSLEQNLLNEKRYRSIAEEDCVQKTKELQLKTQELMQMQEILRLKNEEHTKLQSLLSKKAEQSENEAYENRIRSLTQTLMIKQNTLETVTTERNALRLQLEKLEVEYKNSIDELKRDRVKVINIQETTDERIYVPNFMRVTPHDAGVTRRVKHAYSTLDAISVRTGIFLRRYPLARVFVFSYMVILHIWVLTVLLWYVPAN